MHLLVDFEDVSARCDVAMAEAFEARGGPAPAADPLPSCGGAGLPLLQAQPISQPWPGALSLLSLKKSLKKSASSTASSWFSCQGRGGERGGGPAAERELHRGPGGPCGNSKKSGTGPHEGLTGLRGA